MSKDDEYETPQDIYKQLESEWRCQSDYVYTQPIRNECYAFLYDKGVIVYTIKWNAKTKEYFYLFDQIYKWGTFKIRSFYQYGIGEQKQRYYSFSLQTAGVAEEYSQLRKTEMIDVIQSNAIIQSNKKSYLVSLINQMLQDPDQNIIELDIVNYLGFSPEGWRMPDHYQMVAHNEFRREIEQRINGMIHRTNWGLPDVLMTNGIAPLAQFFMKEIYNLTGIVDKDPLFAHLMIAPFLYALRSKYDLLPFAALGGIGGVGKTALFKFGSTKWWDNNKGVLGSAVLATQARVEGTLSASTLPLCLDDCSDLKPFVIGIIKRYTTVEDFVKKLNRDQTMKMNAPYCTPCLLTYNAYPPLFDDPALRQRIYNRMLGSEDFEKNEDWLELYNFIPNGLIGRYIYEKTKTWTLNDLLDRLDKYQTNPLLQFLDGRGKDLCRLLLLGAELFKEFFGITLDMRSLPADLRDSVKAGNEDIVSLVMVMIEERHNFENTDKLGLHQMNPRHWVQHRVLPKEFKGQEGFILTTDNAIDLAKRMGRKPKDLSLPSLNSLLLTEFNTKYQTFKYDGKNIRGIWISKLEIEDGKQEDEERMKTEIELGDDIEPEFEIPLECEKEEL